MLIKGIFVGGWGRYQRGLILQINPHKDSKNRTKKDYITNFGSREESKVANFGPRRLDDTTSYRLFLYTL